MKKHILIFSVKFIHIMLIFFVLFGWMISLPLIRWAHVLLIPLMILHWKTNNNECILTQWENLLEGRSGRFEGEFSNRFFKSLGINFNDQQLFLVIYGLMLMSFSTSLIFLSMT